MRTREDIRLEKDKKREYFKRFSPFFRYHTVCEYSEIKVEQPNFSSFMSGNNTAVSLDNLEKLENALKEIANEILTEGE